MRRPDHPSHPTRLSLQYYPRRQTRRSSGRIGYHDTVPQNGSVASTERTVLIVANLGTPDSPTPEAVGEYLKEFLGDRRVVDLPRWLWKPLLHRVIAPVRGPKSAALYQKVWLEEGSPLLVHTQRLAQRIAALHPEWEVVAAMTYGKPGLRSVLDDLRRDPPQRIVVLPLYPQYSTTTTAPITDQLRDHGAGLPLEVIEDYHDDPAWIEAVALRIRESRETTEPPRHLLFSYHGLPQRVAAAGDPYPQQCRASAEAIADAAGLAPQQWSMAFQSRFGPTRWLEPATTDQVVTLTEAGEQDLDVICPGFAVDCLETLEEIAIRLAEQVAELGGTVRYLPCLNDADDHAAALAQVVERRLAQTR